MKIIKKSDIILFLILVVFGLAVSLFFLPKGEKTGGDIVKVSVDGEHYGSYSINEDREIEIKNGDKLNIIKIEGGTVRMLHSSCKNQVCVNSGKIKELKTNIVCLPNRVVIEIEGENGGDTDVVSG